MDAGIRQRQLGHDPHDGRLLGRRALQELRPGRRVEEEVSHLDRRPRRRVGRTRLADEPALADDRGTRAAASAGREQQSTAARRRRSAGKASPRNPSVPIASRSVSVAELRGRVPLQREEAVLRRHALPVVRHRDELAAGAPHRDLDARRPRVEAVLHQLLHDRRRALDHLPGGDLVDDRVREAPDRPLAGRAHGSAPASLRRSSSSAARASIGVIRSGSRAASASSTGWAAPPAPVASEGPASARRGRQPPEQPQLPRIGAGRRRRGRRALLELAQESPRARDDLRGQPGQTRHLDAVGAVRPARHHAVEEHDVVLPLPDGDVDVPDTRQLGGQPRQLVVVRREQDLRARPPLVEVLGDRPRDREAVERRRAPPDLVEQDEAPRRRVPQDGRRLGHLHQERALAAREVVLGADPREDPVHHADPRAPGRHEAPDLGQEHDERHLPHVGRLPRHVRAGDQEALDLARREPEVVRRRTARPRSRARAPGGAPPGCRSRRRRRRRGGRSRARGPHAPATPARRASRPRARCGGAARPPRRRSAGARRTARTRGGSSAPRPPGPSPPAPGAPRSRSARRRPGSGAGRTPRARGAPGSSGSRSRIRRRGCTGPGGEEMPVRSRSRPSSPAIHARASRTSRRTSASAGFQDSRISPPSCSAERRLVDQRGLERLSESGEILHGLRALADQRVGAALGALPQRRQRRERRPERDEVPRDRHAERDATGQSRQVADPVEDCAEFGQERRRLDERARPRPGARRSRAAGAAAGGATGGAAARPSPCASGPSPRGACPRRPGPAGSPPARGCAQRSRRASRWSSSARVWMRVRCAGGACCVSWR